MILHQYITQAELDKYCQLCNEHKARTVKVDKLTLTRIKNIAQSTTYQGINFQEK